MTNSKEDLGIAPKDKMNESKLIFHEDKPFKPYEPDDSYRSKD